MNAKRWNIWSWAPAHRSWFMVGEDLIEEAAKGGAFRRNETARRLKVQGAVFTALPDGDYPTEPPENP